MMNSKKLASLIFFTVGCLLVSSFILFFYYYSMKGGEGGLELILPLFGTITLCFFLFSFALIYGIVKSAKESRLRISYFVPLFILAGTLVLSSCICSVDYAFADKATFGIPDKWQETLSYDTFMKKDILDVSYDDGATVTLREDNENILRSYLKTIEVSDPVTEESCVYTEEHITVYYGKDDFYGLKFYSSGCIEAEYSGDLLGPFYEMYYTYDSDVHFETLKNLILSLPEETE